MKTKTKMEMDSYTSPSYWGPGAWAMLHWAAGQKHVNEDDVLLFIQMFRTFLPCAVCKKNFRYHWKSISIPLQIPLKRWLFQLHNTVSGHLKKQEMTWKEFQAIHNKKYVNGSPIPDDVWKFLFAVSQTAKGKNPRSIFWKRAAYLLGFAWKKDYESLEEASQILLVWNPIGLSPNTASDDCNECAA